MATHRSPAFASILAARHQVKLNPEIMALSGQHPAEVPAIHGSQGHEATTRESNDKISSVDRL